MKEYLKGRKHPAAYEEFLLAFMPAVVGRAEFKRRIKSADSDIEFSTVSDEAYALLIVENSYDRWVDIDARSQPEYEPDSDRSGESAEEEDLYDDNGDIIRRRMWHSNVPPKYTSGGIKFKGGDDREKDEAQGWKTTGINRFNLLHKKVTRDRGLRGLFIVKFLKNHRNYESVPKRRRVVVEETKILAVNDLYSSSGYDVNAQPLVAGESDSETEVEE